MPLLLPLAVPFFALIAALVLAGLAKSATAQRGSSRSGTWGDVITGRYYFRQLTGFASDFAHWIVSRFAASQLRLLTRWFMAMGTLTLGVLLGNAAFAEAIVEAVERLEHRGDPRARAKAQAAHNQAIRAGHNASHANAHAGHVGHALDTYKGRTRPILRHHTHAIDVTIPHSIGGIRRREDALSRDLGKLRDRTKSLEDGAVDTFRWIRSHPASAVTGVFAGAVAVALSRLGFGFMRCRDWQKVGRSLTCGMGRWIGELLGFIATFALGGLAVLDPEVLARATVATVDEIEPILARILSD